MRSIRYPRKKKSRIQVREDEVKDRDRYDGVLPSLGKEDEGEEGRSRWRNEGEAQQATRERDYQVWGRSRLRRKKKNTGQVAKAEEERTERPGKVRRGERKPDRTRAKKMTHRSSCCHCLRRVPRACRTCRRAPSRARVSGSRRGTSCRSLPRGQNRK